MIEPRHFITVPDVFTRKGQRRPIHQAQQAPPSSAGSGRARRGRNLGRVAFLAEHALPFPLFCWSFLGALGRGGGQPRPRGPGRALWGNARRYSRHWGRCTRRPRERGDGAIPLPSRRQRAAAAMCCTHLLGVMASDASAMAAPVRCAAEGRYALPLHLVCAVVIETRHFTRGKSGSPICKCLYASVDFLNVDTSPST